MFEVFEYNTSPVDCCEPNYVVSNTVAEFWNTFSSFYFFVIAYWGYSSYKADYEPKIIYIWILITLIGIGSIIFHSTLSIGGQVMDEMSILIFIIYSFLITTPRLNTFYRKIIFSKIFFSIFVLGSILLCFKYPLFSHGLTMFFIPTTTYNYLKTYVKHR